MAGVLGGSTLRAQAVTEPVYVSTSRSCQTGACYESGHACPASWPCRRSSTAKNLAHTLEAIAYTGVAYLAQALERMRKAARVQGMPNLS